METQILDDLQDSKNQEAKWAGFWIRVGASLLDVLVLIPLIVLNFYNLISLKSMLLHLLVIVLGMAYKPWMEYRYGATLGKMAVKIKVVSEGMGKLSVYQAILRNYPFWLDQLLSLFTTVFLFQHASFQSADTLVSIAAVQADLVPRAFNSSFSALTFISVLIVAFTAKKQGLHDMIAKTYCVYN